MLTFMDKLKDRQRSNQSWLCVGIDPHPDYMPDNIDLLTFGKAIVDATADQVCAYKLNMVFFLTYGAAGLQVLQDTIAHVPDAIPVILDAKFGDIGYTAERYAALAYDVLGVDAVTLSPYVGMDAVMPLLDYPGRAVFVLARSANRTGNDFQRWPNQHAPLFRFVVAQLNTLAQKHPGQVGAGVASTQARDLSQIRCWAPNLPFLIPGLGVQEGDVNAAVEHGETRDGIGPLISVTRAIIYASQGGDYAAAARQAAQQWRERLHAVRSSQRG